MNTHITDLWKCRVIICKYCTAFKLSQLKSVMAMVNLLIYLLYLFYFMSICFFGCEELRTHKISILRYKIQVNKLGLQCHTRIWLGLGWVGLGVEIQIPTHADKTNSLSLYL